MITRALQYIHYGPLSYAENAPVYFNKLIQSWTLSNSYPAITYASGNFYIPKASLSDYLITWTMSIKTATAFFGYKNSYVFDMDYSDGDVTEGCFSSLVTTTGVLQGIKVIHVKRISKNDLLSFRLKNNTFYSTTYLATPSDILPDGLNDSDIANICISIISI